eukprot:scaffold12474_cov77-Cyclotella_meneghiniana.AAC.5
MKHYPPPSGHGAGCQDRKPEAGGMLSWDQQRGYPPIALLSWTVCALYVIPVPGSRPLRSLLTYPPRAMITRAYLTY